MSAADWARTAWRHARRAGVIAIGILAAGVVMSLSVDLAGLVPAITLGRVDLRRSAESWVSRQIDPARPDRRPLAPRSSTGSSSSAGSPSAASTPADAPFFEAREILVHVPLWSLLRRELNIVSVEMTDWQMTDRDSTAGAATAFRSCARASRRAARARSRCRWRTCARAAGQFTFQDHATPWGTVVRNLDITRAQARRLPGLLDLVGRHGDGAVLRADGRRPADVVPHRQRQGAASIGSSSTPTARSRR
ncbi:MAG: hypothetical protein MZV64_13715 [Ignavibacteriales bacterium]|nr:hypothetical protein [Ignavibacteriales bacterium]